mmetsp:Transcript_64955/g.120922  ORF Transcript_64955/g.120922 Transcript_64955/m.120922 type:complete len:414 (-) Transcript_64955:260-1501(-)
MQQLPSETNIGNGVCTAYSSFRKLAVGNDFGDMHGFIEELLGRVTAVWPAVEKVSQDKALMAEFQLPLFLIRQQMDKLSDYVTKVRLFCAEHAGKGLKQAAVELADGSLNPESKDVAGQMEAKLGGPPQRLLARLTEALCSRVELLSLASQEFLSRGASSQNAGLGAPMQLQMADSVAWELSSLSTELASKLDAAIQDDLVASQSPLTIYKLRNIPLFGMGIGGRSSFGLIVKGRPYFFMIEQDGSKVRMALLFPLKSPGEFLNPLLLSIAGSVQPGFSTVQSRLRQYIEHATAGDAAYDAMIKEYLDLALPTYDGKGVVYFQDKAKKWQAMFGMCCALSLLPCAWPISCPSMCFFQYMVDQTTSTWYSFDTPDGVMSIRVYLDKVNEDPDKNGGVSGIVVNDVEMTTSTWCT